MCSAVRKIATVSFSWIATLSGFPTTKRWKRGVTAFDQLPSATIRSFMLAALASATSKCGFCSQTAVLTFIRQKRHWTIGPPIPRCFFWSDEKWSEVPERKCILLNDVKIYSSVLIQTSSFILHKQQKLIEIKVFKSDSTARSPQSLLRRTSQSQLETRLIILVLSMKWIINAWIAAVMVTRIEFFICQVNKCEIRKANCLRVTVSSMERYGE